MSVVLFIRIGDAAVNETQITSGEAARRLGVSWSLIWKLEEIGATPPARRIGRWRVYNLQELEALRKIIEERRAASSRHPVEAA